MKSKWITVDVNQETFWQLFFTNRLHLADYELPNAKDLLSNITQIKLSDILNLIDHLDHSIVISTEFVPQFADLDAINKVVDILVESGEPSIKYHDLGYFIKRDNSMLLGAKAKYGENHGKGAALLGLATYKPGEVSTSFFTHAYYDLHDFTVKKKVQTLLMLRIPLIQRLLYKAQFSLFNGYKSMTNFKKSTMVRRGQSARMILRELLSLNDPDLCTRSNNIFWDPDNL